MKKLGKSVLVGVLASLAIFLASLALSVFGIPQLFTAYVFSGTPLSYVLFAVVPNSFIYWFVPEGGGPAAVAIMLISALIQSTAVIALAFFWLSKAPSSNPSFKRDT